MGNNDHSGKLHVFVSLYDDGRILHRRHVLGPRQWHYWWVLSNLFVVSHHGYLRKSFLARTTQRNIFAHWFDGYFGHSCVSVYCFSVLQEYICPPKERKTPWYTIWWATKDERFRFVDCGLCFTNNTPFMFTGCWRSTFDGCKKTKRKLWTTLACNNALRLYYVTFNNKHASMPCYCPRV